jgi:hypothetical protein
MLEIIVERWSSFDGTVEYRWSLWRDGKRVQMGGPHDAAAVSEAAARNFCQQALSAQPDRVTYL